MGIAFQSLKNEDTENISYIIPTPVIEHVSFWHACAVRRSVDREPSLINWHCAGDQSPCAWLVDFKQRGPACATMMD